MTELAEFTEKLAARSVVVPGRALLAASAVATSKCGLSFLNGFRSAKSFCRRTPVALKKKSARRKKQRARRKNKS